MPALNAARTAFSCPHVKEIVTSSREVLYPRSGTDGVDVVARVGDRARAFADALRLLRGPALG